MANCKGLILTSIWMLMIIGCWGEEITDFDDPLPFLNYDMSRCHGTWFEVEKYNGFPLNLYKCVTVECRPRHDWRNSTIFQTADIELNQIFKPSRQQQRLRGTIFTIVRGLLVVNLKGADTKLNHIMMVLDTDYDNYAVLSVCGGKPKFSCGEAIIFTRRRFPRLSVLRRARQAILDKRIPLINKVVIDQTNCPRF